MHGSHFSPPSVVHSIRPNAPTRKPSFGFANQTSRNGAGNTSLVADCAIERLTSRSIASATAESAGSATVDVARAP